MNRVDADLNVEDKRFRLSRPVRPGRAVEANSWVEEPLPVPEHASNDALADQLARLKRELAQVTAELGEARLSHSEEVSRLNDLVSENAKLFSEKVEAEVQARFEVQRETLAQELKAQALEWAQHQMQSEWQAQWRADSQQQLDEELRARHAAMTQAFEAEREARLAAALFEQQESLNAKSERQLSEAKTRWEMQSHAFQTALQNLQERWQQELSTAAVGLAHAALRHVLTHQLSPEELASFASMDLMTELAGERLLRIRVCAEDFQLLQSRWPAHWLSISEGVPGWPRGHCEIQTPLGHWHASLADRIAQLETLWHASATNDTAVKWGTE